MKTLVKSFAFVIVASCVSLSASAMDHYVSQDTIKKDTLKKDAPAVLCLAADDVTYSKVEVADVPEAVKSAVTAKYADYSIGEAYKGSDNSYKLVIKKEEAKLTVYYNEAGEFQKEEASKEVQTV